LSSTEHCAQQVHRHGCVAPIGQGSSRDRGRMLQPVTRHQAKLQSLWPKQHGRRSNACPLLRYAHRRRFRGLLCNFTSGAFFFLSAPCTPQSQERGGTNARTDAHRVRVYATTWRWLYGPIPRRESRLSGQCPARCTSKPQACEAALSVPFLVGVARAPRRPLFCSVECRQCQKQSLGGDQISPG
jgi:hypothetical protein